MLKPVSLLPAASARRTGTSACWPAAYVTVLGMPGVVTTTPVRDCVVPGVPDTVAAGVAVTADVRVLDALLDGERDGLAAVADGDARTDALTDSLND